ncbi:unnamed protein product, partial [Staurois parvus]
MQMPVLCCTFLTLSDRLLIISALMIGAQQCHTQVPPTCAQQCAHLCPAVSHHLCPPVPPSSVTTCA